ncbi:MAG: lipocalin family protein [Lishizhenia sp.]
MRIFTTLFLAITVALLHSCSSPEDKLVGQWEYDSYEIDPSGLGALSQFIPQNIKDEMDNYIAEAGNFSKGNYNFRADGTFESAYTGVAKDFTKKAGHFSLSPDGKILTLKTNGVEKQSHLLELTETHFTEVWELKEYQLPIKINLRYRKVIMN